MFNLVFVSVIVLFIVLCRFLKYSVLRCVVCFTLFLMIICCVILYYAGLYYFVLFCTDGLYCTILPYTEPRIKLRPLVRILPTVFSYRLSTFHGVIRLIMLLSSCLNILSKLSVPEKFEQCTKYKWSILGSLSMKDLFTLCVSFYET